MFLSLAYVSLEIYTIGKMLPCLNDLIDVKVYTCLLCSQFLITFISKMIRRKIRGADYFITQSGIDLSASKYKGR